MKLEYKDSKIHSRGKRKTAFETMCVPLFAFWAGRHNNVSINERTDVRGGNTLNSRVVRLQPLSKPSLDVENEGTGLGGVEKRDGASAGGAKGDQR